MLACNSSGHNSAQAGKFMGSRVAATNKLCVNMHVQQQDEEVRRIKVPRSTMQKMPDIKVRTDTVQIVRRSLTKGFLGNARRDPKQRTGQKPPEPQEKQEQESPV